jgi:hypothetical protein
MTKIIRTNKKAEGSGQAVPRDDGWKMTAWG